MRTITVDWSVPERERPPRTGWLSIMGAKLRRDAAGRIGRAKISSAAPSTRKPHDPFMQADVAAFISTFMRIG